VEYSPEVLHLIWLFIVSSSRALDRDLAAPARRSVGRESP
jgi:hypothetical protein